MVQLYPIGQWGGAVALEPLCDSVEEQIAIPTGKLLPKPRFLPIFLPVWKATKTLGHDFEAKEGRKEGQKARAFWLKRRFYPSLSRLLPKGGQKMRPWPKK